MAEDGRVDYSCSHIHSSPCEPGPTSFQDVLLAVSLTVLAELTRDDGSGASFEASPRAVRTDRLARFTRKLVGVGQAEIDLLALRDQITLLLNVEHRLRCARRHTPVRTEDGHLVL